MGTRADFYVGKGENAEWIGSVAWDGYEWHERIQNDNPDNITSSKTEAEYRSAVADMLKSNENTTTPEMGWPWPWETSKTTDFAYLFVDGKIEVYCFGNRYIPDDGEIIKSWPKFSDENVAEPGCGRSGIIVVDVGSEQK